MLCQITVSPLFQHSTMVAQVLTASFLAILFLQSGIDKVVNWSGNLDWLKGYFAKTFLNGLVPVLLAVITLVEISAGLTSAIGVLGIIFIKSSLWAFIGAALSGMSIVMLFFGQRMAQDYAGAASLVPYFILCIAALMLFGN